MLQPTLYIFGGGTWMCLACCNAQYAFCASTPRNVGWYYCWSYYSSVSHGVMLTEGVIQSVVVIIIAKEYKASVRRFIDVQNR